MRINRVKKSRKACTCSKCRKEIPAGSPYKWVKSYRGAKTIACAECKFASSDLTSSDKKARIFDARDAALEAVDAWDGDDHVELETILDELNSEVQEVADEYREAAEPFPGGELEELADEVDGYVSEIEGAYIAEFDADAAKEDGLDVEKAKEEWADEQRNNARDAIDSCPL